MILETSRLRIREILESDLENLSEMLADEKVMEFSVNGPMSKAQTMAFINWCQSSYNDHGVGPWALISKIDDAFIGFAGLSKECIDGVEEIHIGYRLASKYWGQGFATEAVSAVVDYGFSRKGQNRVCAIIEPEHCSSIRVIEKAGFKLSKQTKFHEKLTNIYVKSNL
uniref:GNAT family N-acetyltransferase n=1 Tax=Thaumasiovibrio occultus TaxID=1891184 RepID=UPI000B35ACFA|nr:GNAT family N-acetyltransferase [Thaumasiovibrio occultus]